MRDDDVKEIGTEYHGLTIKAIYQDALNIAIEFQDNKGVMILEADSTAASGEPEVAILDQSYDIEPYFAALQTFGLEKSAKTAVISNLSKQRCEINRKIRELRKQ